MKGPVWYGQSLALPTVKYCLCLSEEAYLRECKRLKVKFPDPFLLDGSAACVHFFYNDTKMQWVAMVCMDPSGERSLTEHFALLVHEGVHIFQKQMEDWREEAPGKEFEAYSIQRISLDLMYELNQYFKANEDADSEQRKHRQARRNVVRRRGRNNAKRT